MPSRDRISLEISVGYSFDVVFTRRIFSPRNRTFRDLVASAGARAPARTLFFVEEGVLEHNAGLVGQISAYCRRHSDVIQLCRRPVKGRGGEDFKSFRLVEKYCRVLKDCRICRHSFVCIVGGGAFLDTVGFAASIVHRGVRQIRLPTTVLAQADSGVGVKTGLNMFGKKNYLGTFSPPFAVINDFSFLRTLGRRDWVSGISEAFKVAMIKDAEFFDWLCANAKLLSRRSQPAMEELIRRTAKLHIDHISRSGDPFEFGSARPLDFGHWIAHALEAMSGGKIRHGEAVAIGILADSAYAADAGLLDYADLKRLESALKTVGFPLWTSFLEKKDRAGRLKILSGIEDFREHLGGELHITLPDGLGRKIEVTEMDEKRIGRALLHLLESC